MPIDDKFEEESPTGGLESNVKTSFRDTWNQFKEAFKSTNWIDKILLAGSTLASIVAAGFGMTLSMNAVYLAVYGLLQRKNNQKITKKGMLAEAYYANFSAPYMKFMYDYFNMLPSMLSKMAVGFGLMIPFSFLIYFPLKHYLHNYTMKQFVKGIFNGKTFVDGYNSLKGNFWKAYKKILLWSPIPLGLFWYFVPPEHQAILHASVGGATRVGMKAFVDKDIKDVYGKKESIDYNDKKIEYLNRPYIDKIAS